MENHYFILIFPKIEVDGSDDDNYGGLERLRWSKSITERTNPISPQHACDVDESA